MNATPTIRYLRHDQIDYSKWDACIRHAENGLIYAYSWYLDTMAKHWDALVLDDYTAVMPLTWNRKYGLYYLYQPFLTPQLGIVSNNVSAELQQAFLSAIPKKFRFIEINLNTGNDHTIEGLSLKKQADYLLDLGRSYQTISRHYNENLRRNYKKAQTVKCEYRKNISPGDVINLAEAQLRSFTRLQKDDLARFRKLVERMIKKRSAETRGVYLDDQLLSSCIFFFDKNRAYYILAGNDPKGKKFGASHFLLDQFIREKAGADLELDFVGSDIPSIAQFYRSFGAAPVHYRSLRLNNLPPLVKWIKD